MMGIGLRILMQLLFVPQARVHAGLLQSNTHGLLQCLVVYYRATLQYFYWR